MSDKENAIVVFTARSPERIIKEGGSQAWVLNPARAKRCSWLVCTQNRHNPDYEFSDATEPHGSAFLIGKISAIRKSEDPHDQVRWRIEISESARIDHPNAWDHGRNPVRYTSLEDLGIEVDGLKFEPLPSLRDAPVQTKPYVPGSARTSLTIPEAKKALALTFGVAPEAIEITIRG